ncbi:MAG: Mor transcription activator family protein [Guyparkeria sp.]
MPKKNELISTAKHTIIDRATRFGIDKDVAGDIARAVLDDLRQELGGDEYYLPKPSKRAAALADFDGRNHDQVCRKHGIARRTLRAWVRADMVERRASRSGDTKTA